MSRVPRGDRGEYIDIGEEGCYSRCHAARDGKQPAAGRERERYRALRHGGDTRAWERWSIMHACMHAGELTPSFPFRTWRHPATPSFGGACLRAVISHVCYCRWRGRSRVMDTLSKSVLNECTHSHLSVHPSPSAAFIVSSTWDRLQADRGSQPEQCLNGGTKEPWAHGSWPRCRAGSTRPVRPAVSSLRASLPSYNDIADG